jgi:hypothetical protein
MGLQIDQWPFDGIYDYVTQCYIHTLTDHHTMLTILETREHQILTCGTNSLTKPRGLTRFFAPS